MAGSSTLQELFDALRRFGDRPAIVALQKEGADIWPYQKLSDHLTRLAAGLTDAGLRRGDRVALCATRPSASPTRYASKSWRCKNRPLRPAERIPHGRGSKRKASAATGRSQQTGMSAALSVISTPARRISSRARSESPGCRFTPRQASATRCVRKPSLTASSAVAFTQ